MKRNTFISLISLSFLLNLVLACNEDKQLLSSEYVPTNSPITRSGVIQFAEGDASCQLHANEILFKILNGISLNGAFPDFYGGAFTEKGGKLTVLIKGNFEEGKSIIEKLVGDKELIDYKPCKYSFQELNNIMDLINRKYDDLSIQTKENIKLYYISDSANELVVVLNDNSVIAVNDFEEQILKHPAIKFLKMKEITRCYTHPSLGINYYVSPGSRLSNRIDPEHLYHGSWAFRARSKQDTTIVGMVTAAHVVQYYDSIYIANSYFGETDTVVYTVQVDAAFVKAHLYPTPPPLVLYWHLTNTLSTEYSQGTYPAPYNDTVDLDVSTYSPCVGTIINKRGYTTGPTTGEVTSTNLTAILDLGGNHYRAVTNMSAASLECGSGDSGAIVYTYFSSQMKRYTTGILAGFYVDPETGCFYAYYTKADLALQSLNVERY